MEWSLDNANQRPVAVQSRPFRNAWITSNPWTKLRYTTPKRTKRLTRLRRRQVKYSNWQACSGSCIRVIVLASQNIYPKRHSARKAYIPGKKKRKKKIHRTRKRPRLSPKSLTYIIYIRQAGRQQTKWLHAHKIILLVVDPRGVSECPGICSSRHTSLINTRLAH